MTLLSAIIGLLICIVLAFIGVYFEKVNNVPAGKVLQWFGLAVAIIIVFTYLFSNWLVFD